jgi:hypothetical protein
VGAGLVTRAGISKQQYQTNLHQSSQSTPQTWTVFARTLMATPVVPTALANGRGCESDNIRWARRSNAVVCRGVVAQHGRRR